MKIQIIFSFLLILQYATIAASQQVSVAPPPHQDGLSLYIEAPTFRAEQSSDFQATIEDLYNRIEIFSAASTPLAIDIQGIETFPFQQIEHLPARDNATQAQGWILELTRDTVRIDNEFPSVSYLYEWTWRDKGLSYDGSEALMNSLSLGSVLQEVKKVLPEYGDVEYVSIYKVTVEGMSRSRSYKAAIFWAKTQRDHYWLPITHDKILQGVDRIVAETGRARLPDQHLEPEPWRSSLRLQPTSGKDLSDIQCNKKTVFTDFKK